MKATIYIPEEKAELYEKAKKELGGTISAAFVRCMERELEIKHAAMDRIVVEIYNPDADRVTKKAFEGRWVVGDESYPEKHWFDKRKTGIHGGGSYAVAVTKQNRIVVVRWNKDEECVDFDVHESLDQFASSSSNGYPMYPETLVAAVKVELGVEHIEELDI